MYIVMQNDVIRIHCEIYDRMFHCIEIMTLALLRNNL